VGERLVQGDVAGLDDAHAERRMQEIVDRAARAGSGIVSSPMEEEHGEVRGLRK
jgi:hypothetical protein